MITLSFHPENKENLCNFIQLVLDEPSFELPNITDYVHPKGFLFGQWNRTGGVYWKIYMNWDIDIKHIKINKLKKVLAKFLQGFESSVIKIDC